MKILRHLKTKYLLKEEVVEALFEFLTEVNVYMVMDTLTDTLAKAEIDTLNEKRPEELHLEF